LTLVENRVE